MYLILSANLQRCLTSSIYDLLLDIQALASVLQQREQNDGLAGIDRFVQDVAADSIINHKDRDVRTFAACILADTLRLTAPDTPFSDDQITVCVDMYHFYWICNYYFAMYSPCVAFLSDLFLPSSRLFWSYLLISSKDWRIRRAQHIHGAITFLRPSPLSAVSYCAMKFRQGKILFAAFSSMPVSYCCWAIYRMKTHS